MEFQKQQVKREQAAAAKRKKSASPEKGQPVELSAQEAEQRQREMAAKVAE